MFDNKYRTLSLNFISDDLKNNNQIIVNSIYLKLLKKPSNNHMDCFHTAITILASMTPHDRYYYLRRGLKYEKRKTRVFAFYYKPNNSNIVTHEAYICFIPKKDSEEWDLCVIIDTFKVNNSNFSQFFDKYGLSVDGRFIHIERDINAFV